MCLLLSINISVTKENFGRTRKRSKSSKVAFNTSWLALLLLRKKTMESKNSKRKNLLPFFLELLSLISVSWVYFPGREIFCFHFMKESNSSKFKLYTLTFKNKEGKKFFLPFSNLNKQLNFFVFISYFLLLNCRVSVLVTQRAKVHSYHYSVNS